MAETARFIFDQEGQEAQVVTQVDSPTATLAGMALSLKTNLWNAVKPVTSFECDLKEIQVGTVVGGTTLLVGEPGTGGSAACPSNVSILIEKGVVGQRNGRMFWPGLMDDDVDAAGRLTLSGKSSWEAALALVVNNLLIDDVKLVVEHNPAGGPVTESAVVDLFPKDVVGTQRRRLR